MIPSHGPSLGFATGFFRSYPGGKEYCSIFRIVLRAKPNSRAACRMLMNHANFANPVSRLNNAIGIGNNQIQPGQPFTSAAAGGTFGMATSTVTKDVGLGASRQIQLSLRYNF